MTSAATRWESWYLIERPVKGRAHPEYWSVDHWTDDPWEAQRFYMKEGAERFIRHDSSGAFLASSAAPTPIVVSHGFEVHVHEERGRVERKS